MGFGGSAFPYEACSDQGRAELHPLMRSQRAGALQPTCHG
jgi:hypothetical protein